MKIGELVDNILKDAVSLDFKRFIIISNGTHTMPVPVDYLKALLDEEHKIWVANMYRQGN